jgi:hypothetical protein
MTDLAADTIERLLRQALADADVMMTPATLRRVAVRYATLLERQQRQARSPMTGDGTAVILGDLLAGALDDERITLPPRATKRLAGLMAELAEVAGYSLTRQRRQELR